MSVTHGWYRDCQDVMVMRFPEEFTWEQVFEAQDRINAMLSEGVTPVAIVLDVPGSTLKLAHALSNARTLMARRHPRLVKVILVSPAPVTRALGMTFMRFISASGQTFEVCGSLDAAEERLKAAGYMRG